MKRILAVALTLFATILVIGTTPGLAQNAAPLKKVTLLTNFAFVGRHAPFFVGLEKGYYKEAGLDVTISPAQGSGFVITAVDAGKADYGMADTSTVIQSIAKGSKVQGFSIYMDVSTAGLVSLAPHATQTSLLNQSIAASQNDSTRVIVPVILALQKLDPSTVKWVAVDPGAQMAVVFGGQVDLVAASSDSELPTLTRIAAQQAKKVYFTAFPDWGYDVFGYLLVANREKLQSEPDEAKRLAEATARAVQYAVDHPEEAAKIMVKHNPTMSYENTLAQWQQTIKAIDTPYVKEHGYGKATTDRIHKTISLVQDALHIDKELKPADLIVPSGVVQ